VATGRLADHELQERHFSYELARAVGVTQKTGGS
jgi:hypothetical protein